jgi:hypothetical protein
VGEEDGEVEEGEEVEEVEEVEEKKVVIVVRGESGMGEEAATREVATTVLFRRLRCPSRCLDRKYG